MQTTATSGIFASPEEKQKSILVFSFLTLICSSLGVMTAVLPVGAHTTTSFIFNYFVLSFGWLLVYSLFTTKRQLVLPISGYVAVVSVIFSICNYKVNYEKDYHGANPSTVFAVLLAIMFCISVFRFVKYYKLKN